MDHYNVEIDWTRNLCPLIFALQRPVIFLHDWICEEKKSDDKHTNKVDTRKSIPCFHQEIQNQCSMTNYRIHNIIHHMRKNVSNKLLVALKHLEN